MAKAIIPVLIILMFPLLIGLANDGNEIPSFYRPLVDRLSRDGFEVEFLSTLLTDDRAGLIPSVMTLSFRSREMPEIYVKFLDPERILLAKRFLRENLKTLKNMEKTFGVERELVVAILLVESGFGEYTGKQRVFPTLASAALIDSPDNLWSNYLALREIDPELSYEQVEGLGRRKAAWAYHELKCFLKIIRDEKIDPLEIRGSYAGAVGMAQFIPSSYLTYGFSQKGFENWLSDKEEAIYSIANYLKLHGWKKNLPPERKRQIVWYYNHSKPYVETILLLAQKIRQK